MEGVEESVSVITVSVPRLFSLASEGLERCTSLTQGWGINGLLKALDVSQHHTNVQVCVFYIILLQTLLSGYMAKVNSSLYQIRRGCGLEAGTGSHGDEWSHLQHAFRLIQTCGKWVWLYGMQAHPFR